VAHLGSTPQGRGRGAAQEQDLTDLGAYRVAARLLARAAGVWLNHTLGRASRSLVAYTAQSNDAEILL